MAFCAQCGTQMNDSAKFCPSCGQSSAAAAARQAAPVGQTPPEQAQQPCGQPYGQQQHGQPYGQQPPAYQPPVVPGAPPQASIQDAQENKTMAILAYILFFVPLLTGAHHSSPFAKFHTNQGTVLFITALIWGIAYGILSAILIFIPVIGWLLILLIGLMGFLFLALCIVGIVNAVNGKMQPLPVIGKFTVIK